MMNNLQLRFLLRDGHAAHVFFGEHFLGTANHSYSDKAASRWTAYFPNGARAVGTFATAELAAESLTSLRQAKGREEDCMLALEALSIST